MRRFAIAALLLLLAPGPAAADEAPTLKRPPSLKQLVPAEVPTGTAFPADEVAVLLEIQVDAAGRVAEVSVKQGAGEPFDSAALAAARRFEFEPALLSSGEAVPVTINFTLRIRKPAPQPAAAPPPPAKAKKRPAPVRFGGELLERGTRAPLADVEVLASAGGKTLARALTDGEGRFSLSVPAASFQLRAIPTGHQPLDVKVEARPGEQREERFYLEALGTGFETVIESDRVRREVTKQILPKELVERVPGTAGDTLKVVQILPGVARSSFDGGQLVLRGSSPDDSRIFLEGQEIPILFHFGGLRSSFNSVFLDAVTFVPGNFSADYGRAIGGIIDVKVRDPASDTFRGQVDLNLYDAGFALEGPVSDSWSVGGAFRRSYIDSILPAVLPDDAPLSFSSAPRFYDYQLLATWKPSSKQRLRLIGYGSLDKVALLFDRPQGDPTIRGSIDARIMFHNLLALYTRRLTDRLTQESSLQIGLQQFRTELGPDIFFDLDVTRFSFRTAWSYEVARWLTARAGMDILVDVASIDLSSPLRPLEGEDVPPPSTRQFFGVEASSVLYSPAAFLELAARPVDRLTIIGSLRLDWYRAIRSWTVDPRLTVRYKLRPGTTLKAALGSYHQPPSPDQVAEDLGNPDLLAPASMHLSVGLDQRLLDSIDIELTGFHKWLHRQVIRNPAFFFDPAAAPYLNGGSGRIYGLELLVRGRLADRLFGWVAYTFQRSLRTDGPGADERRFDFDQPHLLTLVGTVRIGRGWSAGLRFRLVSGNPYTPIAGAIYDAGSDSFVPLFGASNSARQATFHQLDLRVDKLWTFDRWKLSAYLDIQNVYNQGNQEGLSYSFDYRESQPLTGLPILPILGLRGEW